MEDPIIIISKVLESISDENCENSVHAVNIIVDSIPDLIKHGEGYVHALLNKINISSTPIDYLLVLESVLKGLPSSSQYESFYSSIHAVPVVKQSSLDSVEPRQVFSYVTNDHYRFSNREEFQNASAVAKIMED